ncbi:MAG: Gfo/Idh/MocA family oxidoreductase [bacterium]|nr:Gfo/Idh/MocA family oxidoreductase [bacterium]
MEKLNLGVMGCAGIAWRRVLPEIIAGDSFNLTATASRSREKAEKFAQRFDCEPVVGYDQLLEREDVDAVYIPLPTAMHAQWAIKALEKGKHCLVEKPAAANYTDVQKMVEAARKNNLAVMENFMFIHHSQQQWVKEQIKNGEIGDIRCFRSSFGFPPLPKDNIRYNKELGGGALLDAGVYPLRAAQLFLGHELEVKAASLHIDQESDVDIFGGAFLCDTKGVTAQLAFGFDNCYRCDYEIWGSKGKLSGDRVFSAPPGYQPTFIIEKQNERHEYKLPADNHFIRLFQAFHDSIRNRDFEAQYRQLLKQAELLQDIRNNA